MDYGAESLIRLHVNLLFLISSIFCVYLETLAPKNRLKYKNDCPWKTTEWKISFSESKKVDQSFTYQCQRLQRYVHTWDFCGFSCPKSAQNKSNRYSISFIMQIINWSNWLCFSKSKKSAYICGFFRWSTCSRHLVDFSVAKYAVTKSLQK